MKLVRLVVLATLLAGAGFCEAAQQKIAVIDLRKVFDGYWKTKQADANLKDQATDLDNELKSMEENFKKAQEEYNNLVKGATDQAVASEERDRRKKAAEDKLVRLDEMKGAMTQFRRTAS